VRARSLGADEVEAEIAAKGGGFMVQIVHHFHVVAEKAEGGDDNVMHAVFGKRAKVVENIRLEPGLSGRPAAALPDQVSFFVGNAFGHTARGLD
jgi:hypothetical protein